ncbi:MAG: 4'-phosphopantetheinyl transferase superfamily protein [Paludibacteraceae bacterium]|nr:4'-phosphopantetheinyl transferase superfamily protein [Paludibacteraceae bacterium]
MRVRIFDRMEECTEEAVQAMLPQVSQQRREQALRFRHVLGRFCCLKSWLMLSAMHIGEMEFLYNEHGKPYIEGGPFFSISHCKEAIAVALDDQPVGIDIESVRKVDPELVTRTMNDSEQALIAASDHPERAFTRLWTQKEAILKMQGTGIESFEQLQTILSKYRNIEISTIEKEKYIYTIAYV